MSAGARFCEEGACHNPRIGFAAGEVASAPRSGRIRGGRIWHSLSPTGGTTLRSGLAERGFCHAPAHGQLACGIHTTRYAWRSPANSHRLKNRFHSPRRALASAPFGERTRGGRIRGGRIRHSTSPTGGRRYAAGSQSADSVTHPGEEGFIMGCSSWVKARKKPLGSAVRDASEGLGEEKKQGFLRLHP